MPVIVFLSIPSGELSFMSTGGTSQVVQSCQKNKAPKSYKQNNNEVRHAQFFPLHKTLSYSPGIANSKQ
jgi:hypothetical protein